MVRRGIIPLRLVDDFFHGVTLASCRKSEKVIRGIVGNTSGMCSRSNEYLYDKLKIFRDSTASPGGQELTGYLIERLEWKPMVLKPPRQTHN